MALIASNEQDFFRFLFVVSLVISGVFGFLGLIPARAACLQIASAHLLLYCNVVAMRGSVGLCALLACGCIVSAAFFAVYLYRVIYYRLLSGKLLEPENKALFQQLCQQYKSVSVTHWDSYDAGNCIPGTWRFMWVYLRRRRKTRKPMLRDLVYFVEHSDEPMRVEWVIAYKLAKMVPGIAGQVK